MVTDHPDPLVLVVVRTGATPTAEPRLEVLKTVSLAERNARPSEYFNGCLLDSRGRAGIVCAYTGKLKILEFDDGALKADFDTSCAYNYVSNNSEVTNFIPG